MIIRVPKSHQGRVMAMTRAMGPEATPGALLAMLVDYADTPAGGQWIAEHYRPPVPGPTIAPDPISWRNSSLIEGA